jgi:integrase/recombinase XerD
MSRFKSESLLGLTESFFHNYLQQMRGASGHTVRAYRDALKLFYLFLADQKRKPVADLALDDIQSDALLAFLDHVESRRGNSAVTRNCRLAAVRSFVQHLLRHDVTRAGQYGRILAIRNKKALRRVATYLEPEEARAVIAAIDRRSRNGERDHALRLRPPEKIRKTIFMQNCFGAYLGHGSSTSSYRRSQKGSAGATSVAEGRSSTGPGGSASLSYVATG